MFEVLKFTDQKMYYLMLSCPILIENLDKNRPSGVAGGKGMGGGASPLKV